MRRKREEGIRKKSMDGDKLKELFDGFGDGVWKDNGWPTDFDAILRIYEEESRKIRY